MVGRVPLGAQPATMLRLLDMVDGCTAGIEIDTGVVDGLDQNRLGYYVAVKREIWKEKSADE